MRCRRCCVSVAQTNAVQAFGNIRYCLYGRRVLTGSQEEKNDEGLRMAVCRVPDPVEGMMSVEDKY
jgi:hypothetical protein